MRPVKDNVELPTCGAIYGHRPENCKHHDDAAVVNTCLRHRQFTIAPMLLLGTAGAVYARPQVSTATSIQTIATTATTLSIRYFRYPGWTATGGFLCLPLI